MLWLQSPRARRLVLQLALGFAALSVAGCGGDAESGVQTNIVQLDQDGANVLSTEMAQCVRQAAEVDIADDFLVIGERIPLDMEVLPPELGQALVACLAQADGVPDHTASTG